MPTTGTHVKAASSFGLQRVQPNSLGASVSAQVVAGVCTQTPERQTQAREFRGLSTDPGHDPHAPQGIELHPLQSRK